MAEFGEQQKEAAAVNNAFVCQIGSDLAGCVAAVDVEDFLIPGSGDKDHAQQENQPGAKQHGKGKDQTVERELHRVDKYSFRNIQAAMASFRLRASCQL